MYIHSVTRFELIYYRPAGVDSSLRLKLGQAETLSSHLATGAILAQPSFFFFYRNTHKIRHKNVWGREAKSLKPHRGYLIRC